MVYGYPYRFSMRRRRVVGYGIGGPRSEHVIVPVDELTQADDATADLIEERIGYDQAGAGA